MAAGAAAFGQLCLVGWETDGGYQSSPPRLITLQLGLGEVGFLSEPPETS